MESQRVISPDPRIDEYRSYRTRVCLIQSRFCVLMSPIPTVIKYQYSQKTEKGQELKEDMALDSGSLSDEKMEVRGLLPSAPIRTCLTEQTYHLSHPEWNSFRPFPRMLPGWECPPDLGGWQLGHQGQPPSKSHAVLRARPSVWVGSCAEARPPTHG